MLINVQRLRKTIDGIFGKMTVGDFNCFTVENLARAIPAGTYNVNFTYSPRFQRVMPHIIVPSRDIIAPDGDAGIRIHWANYPSQLEGCIAVGDKQVDDAVEDSRDTFAALIKIINGQQDLQIQIVDIQQPV